MGKTKTAVVSGMPDDKKSGEEKYKEKQKRKKEVEALKKGQVKGVGLKGGERIKTVSGDELAPDKKETEKKAKKQAGRTRVRGKKYKDASAKVDKNKLYPLADAIKLVKETSYSKFDGTVEFHAIVKKEGLTVNVSLPHASGKTKKIEIAGKNTLAKLDKGKINFDVLLATPEMMPKLVPYAKLLGPKGLMPNPKNGTIVKDKSAAKQFSVDTLTLKTEKKVPIIHTTVGKVSNKEKILLENTQAVIDALSKRQIRKAYLASTQGPSVKLAIS